jgi:hypothetical protein
MPSGRSGGATNPHLPVPELARVQSCNMGQHSSRPAGAQPAQALEPETRTPEARPPSGLTPRNAQARLSCNAKRVRRLIRQGRLAPCYTGAEQVGRAAAGAFAVAAPALPVLSFASAIRLLALNLAARPLTCITAGCRMPGLL